MNWTKIINDYKRSMHSEGDFKLWANIDGIRDYIYKKHLANSSVFSMSAEDLLNMTFVDGKLVKSKNDSNDGSSDNDDTSDVDGDYTEDLMTVTLNEFFNEDEVAYFADVDADMQLSDEEKMSFLSYLIENSNDNKFSIDDLDDVYSSIVDSSMSSYDFLDYFANNDKDDYLVEDVIDEDTGKVKKNRNSGGAPSSGGYSSIPDIPMTQEELNSLSNKSTEELETMKTAKQSELDAKKTELEEAQKAEEKYNEAIEKEKEQNEQYKQLSDQLDGITSQLSTIGPQIEAKKSELAQCCLEIDSLSASSNSLSANDETSDQKNSIESQISQLTARKQAIEAEISALEQQKTTLENQQKDIEASMEKVMSDETKEARDNFKNSEVKISELEGQISTINAELNEIENQLSKVKKGDDIVKFANQFVGKSEDEMLEILSSEGYQFDRGAWCADFVSYCVGKIVGESNLPDWYRNCNRAYCPSITKHGLNSQERVPIAAMQPGDILMLGEGGTGSEHAVIFAGWVDEEHNRYYTIERSYSDGGDQVCFNNFRTVKSGDIGIALRFR